MYLNIYAHICTDTFIRTHTCVGARGKRRGFSPAAAARPLDRTRVMRIVSRGEFYHMHVPTQAPPFRDAARALLSATHVLIAAGAGFSKDSGLPVYDEIAHEPAWNERGLTYSDLCRPSMMKTVRKITHTSVSVQKKERYKRYMCIHAQTCIYI